MLEESTEDGKLYITSADGFDSAMKQINAKLEGNPPLEHVDIAFNSRQNPQEQFEILSEISSAQNLKSLRITGSLPKGQKEFETADRKALKNIFEDRHIEKISKILGNNIGLENVYLSCCGITDDRMEPIAEAVSKLSSLKTFTSFGNVFGDRGATKLIGALSQTSSLEELGLNSTIIKDDALKEAALQIKNWPNLESIEIGVRQPAESAVDGLSNAIVESSNSKLTNARLMGSHTVFPAREVGGLDINGFTPAYNFAESNKKHQRLKNPDLAPQTTIAAVSGNISRNQKTTL